MYSNFLLSYYHEIILGLLVVMAFVQASTLRKKPKFTNARFLLASISVLLLPTLFTILIGVNFLIYIILATIIGISFEWALGKTFLNVFGEYLWKYDRGNINYFTSWLTLPFWANAGLVFYLIAKVSGL